MRASFPLPDIVQQEIDHLRIQTDRFRRGEISPEEFRACRVLSGVYEERRDNTYMVRIRLPAGVARPDQMRAAARVAREFADGVLHVTTRQDVQLHCVPLDNICPALLALAAAGLSTRGGGGNGVRNVTTCFDAGVCSRECFDVTPWALALTEFFLKDPLSFRLPRKFKTAFSGCPRDCAAATVHDLGFVAKVRNGAPGFSVYVGGGLGACSRVADKLDEFVPADGIFQLAEAVKRVFYAHGNRRNKSKARFRFLVERLGFEPFRRLLDAELHSIPEVAAPPVVHARFLPPRSECLSVSSPLSGFLDWLRGNVIAQREPRYHLVHIYLPLGEIAADTLEKLADLANATGERVIRATQSQNLVLRWVHESELIFLHARLCEIGLAAAPPALVRDAVCCPGTSTCKLGICHTRGLTRAIFEELARDGLDLHAFSGLALNVSGCPNACGRHPVGSIGLHGVARRVDGRPVPHYVLHLGGVVAEGNTALARVVHPIPARNVPTFLAQFLKAFQRSAHCRDFAAFLRTEGAEIAARLVSDFAKVPPYAEDSGPYFDWETSTPFSPSESPTGECGAELADSFHAALREATDALGNGGRFAAVALAARAGLLARGIALRDDTQAFATLSGLLPAGGLDPSGLRALLEAATAAAQSPRPEEVFRADADQLASFIDGVRRLFAPDEAPLPQPSPARPDADDRSAQPSPPVQREADLRGIPCPLNYARFKVLLEDLRPGDVLCVLLDGDGARSVPASAQQDGHTVLSLTREEGFTRAWIRRA